jgi:hypothetical protein
MILVIDRRHDRPWASILVRSILKDFLLSIDYFRGRPDARHCRGAGLPLSSHLYLEVSAYLVVSPSQRDWLERREWTHPFIAESVELRWIRDCTDKPDNGIE